MKIPTGFRFCMPCEWSAASCLASPLFPPRGRKAFHEAVLQEILEERVVARRGRRNPRGVKRKMSSFPLRRNQPISPPVPDIEKRIRIVK